MTVPAGTARIQYYGSGSTGPFSFPFTLYDTTHLKIVKTSLLGVDTTLTLTTDYSVTIAPGSASASITLVAALAGTGIPASSEKLTITRDPPVSQLVEWARNDPFPFSTHQRAADLAVMLIDRLNEKIGRSLLLPESSSFSGLTLPDPTANAFLQWNAGGTALQNQLVVPVGSLVVSPFMTTVLDDTTAAAARTTLGAGVGDVVGPASAVNARLASFNGTTGKLIADAGVTTLTVGAGKQSIWIPKGALYVRPGVSNGSFTAGVEGIVIPTYDFDPAGFEAVYMPILMPKGWNVGTLSAQFVWRHAATATNFGVVWGMDIVALSDNELVSLSFTSGQSVTDTGGVTDRQYITAETAAVTPTNSPAQGDMLWCRFFRDATQGADTLAIDASLIGVMLFYTTNANTDV